MNIFMIVYPIYLIRWLYRHQEVLVLSYYKKKFGALYMGIKLKQYITLFYPVIFMVRRAVVVLI